MNVIGTVVCFAFGLMLILDSLLNLAGCGDRFGKEHRTGNFIEIGIGCFLIFSSFYFK